MAIIFSFIPILLLGHGIENINFIALLLLVAYILGYRCRQVRTNVVGALVLGSMLIFLAMLQEIGFEIPFFITILLASSFYLLSAPRVEISQTFLSLLNISLLAYILYFCVFNTELSFGVRSIGGFSDNSLLGRFAFNFGFGSPARAAVILFAVFIMNLKQSQAHFKLFFLSVFFVLIIMTLNRITILFTIFIVTAHFSRVKVSSWVYFYGSFILMCVTLALPDYFPVIERLERLIAVVNFEQTSASFRYIPFVDSGQAPAVVERSADWLLAISVVNLGFLGVAIYLLFFLVILLWAKSNANLLLIFYFLLISFKNFSFTYDLVSITLFIIAKSMVTPTRSSARVISKNSERTA